MAVRRILEASGVQIEWEVLEARAENTDKGTTGAEVLNAAAIESVRRNHVALKGPMATAIAGGARSVNVALRKSLELYANLRPVKNLPGVKSHFDDVDVVIVRENTEDLYSGLEHEVVPGVVESLKIITEKASTKIAKFAFEYARKTGRKKIHAIHKANIMKMSDGLFLRSVRVVAEKFPEVEYKELIVDNACMQIVIDPAQFDILLLPNLYGDVMSDLAAGLVGGLGVVPSGNIGDEGAIFERRRVQFPDRRTGRYPVRGRPVDHQRLRAENDVLVRQFSVLGRAPFLPPAGKPPPDQPSALVGGRAVIGAQDEGHARAQLRHRGLPTAELKPRPGDEEKAGHREQAVPGHMLGVARALG